MATAIGGEASVTLPRIIIKFCTQCKWMLRAAYFAQELLSTFSTAIGEVALVPSTGGIFTVDIEHAAHKQGSKPVGGSLLRGVTTKTTELWDRKREGGFPETKELKKRVRDIIEPGRDLGHVDGKKSAATSSKAISGQGNRGIATEEAKSNPDRSVCEDCT